MSLLRVTQFLTAEGKVQVELTNTSGRSQRAASLDPSEPPQQSRNKGHRARHVPDRDDPCSLIVSLRASHPQFFYHRGLQHKQLFSSRSVASPLRGSPSGSAAIAGASGSRGSNNTHQRGSSSLWGLKAVDPVIQDVSQETWRSLGFLPVASPAAETVNAAAPQASSPLLRQSNNKGGDDDRPLLVREELADCVLLPGERRTFLLEVDTPSVLERLMAPVPRKKVLMTSTVLSQPENTTRRGSWRPLSSQGSATAHAGGNDDETDASFRRARGVTGEFHQDRHGTSDTDESSSVLPLTARRPGGKDAGAASRNEQRRQGPDYRGRGLPQSPSGRSSSGENSDGSMRSFTPSAQLNQRRQLSRQRTLPWGPDDEGDRKGGAVDQAPPGNSRHNRRPVGKRDISNTEDDDEHSASQQPLSIMRESLATRESLDARLPAATATGVPRPAPSGSAARNSRLGSRDYTVPTSTNSTAASVLVPSNANREDSGRLSVPPSVGTAGSGATPSLCNGEADKTADLVYGDKPLAQPWFPPVSSSQRPTFYVYYAPLGDEDKCVDEARQWLLKEQQAYYLWLDKLVRIIADLERRREQGWTQTRDNAVQSPHQPLGARRVLPPILGELVRWRTDGGGGGTAIDMMAPSPITAAAFQYYYGSISLKVVHRPLSQVSIGGSSAHYSWVIGGNSNGRAGGGRVNKEVVVELPPSFAATRRNWVSKKARKMFKGERQGAGTVVLPLRVQPQSAMQPPPKPFTNDAPSVSVISATQSTLSSSRASQEMRGFSEKPEPQYGSNATDAPSSRQQLRWLRSNNPLTSPQQHTMENSSELGDYRGSSTPMSGSQRVETGGVRPHFKAGCGLALLEDSALNLPPPSRNSLADGTLALPPKNDNTGTLLDLKQGLLVPGSSKVGRTETLDPAAAEMAAMASPSSRWSSLSSIYHQMHRKFSDTPVQPQPRLESLPPAGGMAFAENHIPSSSSSSAEAGDNGTTSHDAAQPNCSSSLHLSSGAPDNARSPEDSTSVTDASGAVSGVGRYGNTSSNGGRKMFSLPNLQGAATDGALTTTSPPGSFGAQIFQSLLGFGGSPKPDAGEEGNAPSRTRDISSAPPQTLAYRRSSTGAVSTGSFLMRRQERLSRIADQSMMAGCQVKIVMQQLTATAADLVQQHGPPAMNGVMSLMTFLKDIVFTPENVNAMQVVVTPMLMGCSFLVIAYLLLFSGEGGGDALSPMDTGGLL
ncbi:hypothetical protein NXY56_001865 [Leishmania guyanensis]